MAYLNQWVVSAAGILWSITSHHGSLYYWWFMASICEWIDLDNTISVILANLRDNEKKKKNPKNRFTPDFMLTFQVHSTVSKLSLVDPHFYFSKILALVSFLGPIFFSPIRIFDDIHLNC